MILLRRPSEAWLVELADRERRHEVTYDAVGATAHDTPPAGYRPACARRVLGTGDEAFERAAHALQHWVPQRAAGFSVGFDGRIEPGATVAIAAPLPVGFTVLTARIVYVEHEADGYAWAYGSLPIHPLAGEERFAVVRRGDEVVLEISSFSRLRHPLARLAPPMAHHFQDATNRRYLDAMADVVRVG